jgi:hypothetical protein
MPIPKPKNNERKSEFITRCMENLKDKGEFPDSKQRLAVCYNQYEEKKTQASIVAQIGDEEILFFNDWKDDPNAASDDSVDTNS